MSPEETSRDPGCVLDASALLAVLHGEPGGEAVEELLGTSAISSVNWSEVIQKALEKKTGIEGLREELKPLASRSSPSPPSWRRRPLFCELRLGRPACPSEIAPVSRSPRISGGPP